MRIKPVPPWGALISLSLLATPLPSLSPAISQVPLTPSTATPKLKEQAQPKLTSLDQKRLNQLIAESRQNSLQTESFSKNLEFFALKLLGQPYQASLLDQAPTEELFLSLTHFDCVLFVETVLALAHSAKQAPHATQNSAVFATQVQNLRYRDGIQDGYCSRLHYFSDWLNNNQTHGYLQNISRNLGGIPLNKQLQFMSRHRNSYPKLQSAKTYDCIVQMENHLASLPMDYIPTPAIDQIEHQLQPGDIIAVATSVPYLDVTHTGLIYQEQNGRKGLVHASPGGSVRLARDLTNYVSLVDSAIGIMVARPINPDEKQSVLNIAPVNSFVDRAN